MVEASGQKVQIEIEFIHGKITSANRAPAYGLGVKVKQHLFKNLYQQLMARLDRLNVNKFVF